MKEMSRGRQILAIAIIGLFALGPYMDCAINPIGSAIFASFPEASDFALNFILSGPILILGVMALLTGFITRRFGVKRIAIIGMVIFTIGAVGFGLVPDVRFVIFCRVLQGFGGGLMSVCATILITRLWRNENVRARMFGIYYAICTAVGAILSVSAGAVGAISWTRVSLIFLVMIPIIILTISFLPSDKDTGGEATVAAEPENPNGAKIKTGWSKVICGLIAVILLNIVICGLTYLSSFFLGDKGINPARLVLIAGIFNGVFQASGFIANTFFGWYYRRLRKAIPLIAWAILFVGFLLLWLVSNIVIIMIVIICMSMAYSAITTYTITNTSLLVPQERNDYAMSVFTFSTSFGAFISTYVVSMFESMLGTSHMVPTIPLLACITLVCVLLAVLQNRQKISDAIAIDRESGE